MKIAGYQFSGPWVLPTTLNERPGVFVVLCERQGGYRVIGVGNSANVQKSLGNHDGPGCSSICCPGSLRFAAHYCDAETCLRVVSTVKQQVGPPCRRMHALAHPAA